MSQPPSTRATASSTPSSQVKPNGIDLSQPAVPHTLIPEALGFVPQLLLDDVINIANDAVHVGVNAMEEFLQDWAEKRARRLEAQNRDAASAAAEVEELDKEIEQGLVAFQTLLEYHTDLGFDMFETWARRNIFAFPPHLKLVLPHHEGLDLTTGGKEEDELMGELEELRKQIQMQRMIRRQAFRALHVSHRKHEKAVESYNRLAALLPPETLAVLTEMPSKLMSMYSAVSSLPASSNPEGTAEEDAKALTQLKMQLSDPGRRAWETSRAGYVNWAIGRLKSRVSETGGGRNGGSMEDEIARVDHLRKLQSREV